MSNRVGALIILLALAGTANAQVGEILGVIGGVLSAGKARQEKEQAASRQEEMWQARELERQKEAEDREARELERQRKIEDRIAGLLEGRIDPANAEDLEILYDAEDGWDIAASPLVKPDKQLYVISGRVQSLESDTVILAQTLKGRGQYIGNYFTIRLLKKTKKDPDILERLRINGPVALVGKYTRNQNYRTIAAGMKVMPVFEAEHIIIPNYLDSGSQ